MMMHACPRCVRPENRHMKDPEGVVRLTADADGARRRAFARAMTMERQYAAKLRSIAKHIGDLVRAFNITDLPSSTWVAEALRRYANALTPWAEAVARTTVTEIAARDERAWFAVAALMGRELRQELAAAPVGVTVQRLMAEQVTLIRSIPLEAAERVHTLAIKGIEEGGRADALVDEIMRQGEVSKSKATLIARTETGRISTVLTQARAEHIGSEGYRWRTIGDSDVRPSHKAMAGKFVKWTDPPELDGLTGHAGALPNCRCYCEPVLPDHLTQ